jgi:hypothetical protein
MRSLGVEPCRLLALELDKLLVSGLGKQLALVDYMRSLDVEPGRQLASDCCSFLGCGYRSWQLCDHRSRHFYRHYCPPLSCCHFHLRSCAFRWRERSLRAPQARGKVKTSFLNQLKFLIILIMLLLISIFLCDFLLAFQSVFIPRILNLKI